MVTVGGCSVADTAPRTTTITSDPAQADPDVLAESTYLPECAPDTLVKRPESYVLACSDGAELLAGMQWRAWGEESSTANGTYIVNDCIPTCAEGHDISTPVRVMADQRVVTDGSATYQRLTITLDTEDGQGVQTVYSLPESGIAQQLTPGESPTG